MIGSEFGEFPNWWQWWLLGAITINTIINLIVFFRGRKVFKKNVNTDMQSTINKGMG